MATRNRVKKRYNWGANYVRMDTDIAIAPPAYQILLCVRVVQRIAGYQTDDGFLSFLEYSKRKAAGVQIGDVSPISESKAIFALDIWKGDDSPWEHAHTEYCGFYRLPEVSNEYWYEGPVETDRKCLVVLNQPSLITSCGYDLTMPGIYLAQSYQGEDGFKNWAIHHPGYRLRSTNKFCVRPQWRRTPDISVAYWLPLPDLSCALSFR